MLIETGEYSLAIKDADGSIDIGKIMEPDPSMSTFQIMVFVSIICNIFTLILSLVVMHTLYHHIKHAKKNREIKRINLYYYSALFVSLIFV
jgi:hypothetical protein